MSGETLHAMKACADVLSLAAGFSIAQPLRPGPLVETTTPGRAY